MKNTGLNLLFLSLGTFISYSVYGILQEKVTKTVYSNGEKFNYYFCMLLIQCCINAIFAKVGMWYTSERQKYVPPRQFMTLAFTYIAAMLASNSSLKYVNYPTQVVGKSVKPIPVMILSVLWAKKKYPLKKYLFVSLIIVGVVMFLYKDKSGSNTEWHVGTGEMLLLLSLLLDGFTGGIQQDLLSRYKVNSYQLMFNMNLFSMFYLIICASATLEVKAFMKFVNIHPEALGNITLFGLCSAIGQVFLFNLIASFGPLMTSIVTTTRKFFTVLSSIVIFGHLLSSRQYAGTVLVFSGLLADQIWGKSGHHALHPAEGKDHGSYNQQHPRRAAKRNQKVL